MRTLRNPSPSILNISLALGFTPHSLGTVQGIGTASSMGQKSLMTLCEYLLIYILKSKKYYNLF